MLCHLLNYFLAFSFFFFHLILLVGGDLLYNIVVVFTIHWHESAMGLHVIPPPASLPIPSLWVFPVHQPWAHVSCIQPGLVICFTLDSMLVSKLFSQDIPPSPSPTESKSLFCNICVSFFVLHVGLSISSFKIPYICISILYWSLSFWLSFLYSPALTFIRDTGKTIALTRWTFVGKVMSLLFNMLS